MPWFDVDNLTASAIVSDQPAILPFAVDDVGIFGVDSRFKPIAAHRDKPMFVGNADAIDGADRPAQCAVVLRAAVDEVEGFGVVYCCFVKLCEREILHELPVVGAVKGDVHAAVTADDHVARVVGVDPQCVVVDVPIAHGDGVEGGAAVFGDMHVGVQRVDTIDVGGIAENLVVILRARRAVIGAFFP